MQNITRKALLATTAFAVAAMLGAPAQAADKTSLSKLQEQISELQKQINDLKTTTAKSVAAPAAPVANAAAPATAGDKAQAAIQQATGVKVQLGGFFDMTGIYRTKNQGSEPGSSYAGIPFGNSANAHQSEFHGTARNTRVSLLASASPNKDTDIAGYFEVDFAGTGVNSNAAETTNYVPRLRQAYATYTNNEYGIKVLGGQAWSLATQNSVGITERKENLPMVIDAAFVPGYVYTRAPQLRIVKSFDENKINVGLSAEAPDAILGSSATAANNINSPNNTNINGTLVNSTVESVPDIIAKVTYDPGFGHYEVFGMGRTFHNHNSTSGSNSVFTANGGASVLFKTLDGQLDITANGIIGQSTGRYAPGLLADYT
jgi:hypothetical protein